MTQIKVSVLQPKADKAALEAYATYVSSETSESDRTNAQRALEQMFVGMYGKEARVVGNNEFAIPDYKISGASFVQEVLKYSPFIAEGDDLTIEAKFQRKSETSSTPTTLTETVITRLSQELGLDVDSSQKAVFDYINSKASKSGEVLFNFLKDNTPAFHMQAYNKAKNMALYTRVNGSIRVYQIYFPINEFRSGIFGARYISDIKNSKFSIRYFLNNSFEKKLIEASTPSIVKFNEEQMKKVEKSFKNITIGFGNTQNEDKVIRSADILIETYHSASIPMLNVRGTITKNKQKPLPSIIDITQAVQGRVRLKMRRSTGEPRPPKITERSGTFRGSIRAYINTRTKLTNYYYLPYYDSLEEYGYDILNMVENSVRAVSREKYNIDYNLRRSRN